MIYLQLYLRQTEIHYMQMFTETVNTPQLSDLCSTSLPLL